MKRRILALLVTFAIAFTLGVIPASAGMYPAYDYELQFGSFGTGDGQFWSPGSVGIGPYGDVYVSDPDYGRIQQFSEDGEFKRVTAVITQPGGTAFGNNALYIAHSDGKIQICDAQGGVISEFGSLGGGDGQFDNPNGIAIDRFGNIYVTDAYNRVQKFTHDGSFIASLGTTGTADGQFMSPGGIAIGLDDFLYVADIGNGRIQKFELDGTYVDQWASPARSLAVDGGETIYANDYVGNEVMKYDSDGTYINQIGGPGTGDGEFQGPTGLAADQWRRVYVSDRLNYRVQRFFSPVPTVMSRTWGDTRLETAVAASQKAYPRGLHEDPEGYKTVLVTTAFNWPDAMGGSALAGILDAPILLVRPDILTPDIATEIRRLGADRVIILGGSAAVSDDVARELEAVSGIFQVDRIGGSDRYDTANMIASTVVTLQGDDFNGQVFVATGLNFPDALAAAPMAARNGEPIFLCGPGGLSPDTCDTMTDIGVRRAYILGGTAAVPVVAEEQAFAISGDTHRFSGVDRYDTAVQVAEYGLAYGQLTMARTALATGENFPDALAGGVLQGRYCSVLLLTRSTELVDVVAQELETRAAGIYELNVLGGPSAIGTNVADEAAALLY